MVRWIWIWLAGVMVAVSGSLMAMERTTVSSVVNQTDLGRWILYLEDAHHAYALEDVKNIPDRAWVRNQGQLLNFGYTDAAYWFKLPLYNDDTRRDLNPLLLEIGYGVLDRVEVYLVRDAKVVETTVLGDKIPFAERLIQNRHFLVPLNLPSGADADLYLRVVTTSSMQFPLLLWDEHHFYQIDQARMISHGVYFGIVLVMIIYNLFVFMAIGERTYLHYVLCIFSMAMFLAAINGLTFQYLWPNATWWNDQSILVFLNATVLFGCLFSLKFLTIDRHSEKLLYRYVAGLGGTALVLLLASFFMSYRMIISFSIASGALAAVSLIVMGGWRWFRGQASARYFTVAWFLMLAGSIVLALNKYSMLPQNLLTENAIQIGSALEIILLSIALADRLNHEKRKAFEAQQKALELEREARAVQAEYLEAQRTANQRLEERVAERTRELEKVNEKLLQLSCEDALSGLKNRGYFDQTFKQVWLSAYRYKQPLALLVADIDHFKRINDQYGHLMGDECLRLIAQSLRKLVVRPQDVIARYGGEEFVMLLPDTSEEGAMSVAERIRARVESLAFHVADQAVPVTISIGVNVGVPQSAQGREPFFKQADDALYLAKARGRNQVCLATPQNLHAI